MSLFLSSGPWAWKFPWKCFINWNDFDYIVLKTHTLTAHEGNGPLYKTLRLEGKGVRNRMGLKNGGVWEAERIYKSLPKFKQHKTIVSLATGPKDLWSSPVEFLHMFQSVSPAPPMFELNLSCPSVSNTGELPRNYSPDWKTTPDPWQRLFDGCVYMSQSPLLLKVAVDTSLSLIERALGAGVTGIVASNSHPFWDKDGLKWGLSGPYVLPRNLDYVHLLRRNFPKARIIAGGGIYRVEDAFRYLDAGAGSLALGSIFLRSPLKGRAIARKLREQLCMGAVR